MRIVEEIARFGLKIFAHHRFNFKFTYEQFNPKRKEPYFLIANHASSNDPLYLGMQLKYYPYPVANALLYTKPGLRFGLTKVVKSIVKRKGQSDIATIKDILETFRVKKRGVMLFPEGNASYFGEETPTDFLSTAKLLKKVKEDCIIAKIHGGFFAQPRWGKHVKKGHYQVHFKRLFSKEELEVLTVHQINETHLEVMKFNDYEWNKKAKLSYKGKQKAIGLEHYLYGCPTCKATQTIKTNKNDIYCKSCGKIATIGDDNFLVDAPFKTLIEWDYFQKTLLKGIIKKPIQTEGVLFDIDFKKQKRFSKGLSKITLDRNHIHIETNTFQKNYPIHQIKGLALTQKNFISFDVEDQTYDIEMMHAKLFLDAYQFIKGDV